METIVLIGYQGVGKTTFGKRLAKHLSMDFIDTDEEMERLDPLGRTAQQIFLGDGEASFKKKEKEILESLVGVTNLVIATGGGVVDIPNVDKILAKFKKIFYLYTDFDILKHRWHGRRAFLKEMNDKQAFEYRDNKYRKVCSEIVEGSWDQILLVENLS